MKHTSDIKYSFMIFDSVTCEQNPDGWGLSFTCKWRDGMSDDEKEKVIRYLTGQLINVKAVK